MGGFNCLGEGTKSPPCNHAIYHPGLVLSNDKGHMDHKIMGLKLGTTGFNRMICSFGIVPLYVDIVFKTPNAEDPASHKSGLRRGVL